MTFLQHFYDSGVGGNFCCQNQSPVPWWELYCDVFSVLQKQGRWMATKLQLWHSIAWYDISQPHYTFKRLRALCFSSKLVNEMFSSIDEVSNILYILSWLPSILLIFGVHFNPSFINLLILWVSDRALSGQAPRTVHFCRVDRTWVPQKIPNVRATSGGQPLRGEWSGEWVEAARFWGKLKCNRW